MALDQDTATYVLDLLQQPPAANKYEVLKQWLLDSFSLMDTQCTVRLLHMLGLGDDKPSQLMDRMLALSNHVSCSERYFMQQLPTDICTILTQAKIINHQELAIAADALWAANNPGIQVIHGPRHCSGRTNRMSAHTSTSNPETPGVCYFHQRFGDAARQCPPPYSFATKGNDQPSVATMAAGTKENSLFIQDHLSGWNFLIDTGVQVSVLPATNSDMCSDHRGPILTAANGNAICTFGKCILQLKVGLQHFLWEFILADVSQPILGVDFLRTNLLLVDLKGQRLINATTFASIPNDDATPQHHSNHRQRVPAAPRRLSRTPTFSDEHPKHGVEHHITTHGAPVHVHTRRLLPEKLDAIKAEFDAMEAMGVVRQSNSPWSSPLHVVTKADSSWHPCGDYRRLNDVTTPDRYPVPHIQDFSAQLAGTCIYSKVDLVRGYHQIPVHHDDIAKMAVITLFGLYEFLRMPFGLKNAAQAFQRLMDMVCRGLHGIFVYLDDILIASSSHEQHLQHIRVLFDRLKQYSLVVKLAKCVFGIPEINFLSHHISCQGAISLPIKVTKVHNFTWVTTVRGLQEFVGMVNFYHRFVPAAA